mmetsp:Transcript_36912/g.115587  ORF Transcript_36912/g.115587 Transcript_36912/m.115587 type:complete len:219 (+) Transcript_36912:478-1134(+)
MHIPGELALALRLVEVELRLLGDGQRKILLRVLLLRDAALEGGRALQHLDMQRAAARHRDEGVVLAAVLPEVQRRDGLIQLEPRHELLLAVAAHLAVGERHEDGAEHEAAAHEHGRHVGDGRRHAQAEGAAALHVERLQPPLHGAHVNEPVGAYETHDLGFEIDDVVRDDGRATNVAALDGIDLAVAARDADAPLHLECAGNGHIRGHRRQRDAHDDG